MAMEPTPPAPPIIRIGVVFDYAADKSKLGLMERASRNLIAWYLARAGEPIRLFFDPVELSARITAMGFRYVENLSSNEINARYCLEGRSRLQLRGLHIISARIGSVGSGKFDHVCDHQLRA